MSNRLILPRSYAERPALDLRKHHFRRQHRGVLVFGTWLRDEYGDYRPCLAFGPARVPVGRWLPCILTIESAFQFTEEVGDFVKTTEELMHFAEAMQWDQFNSDDLARILDAIRDNLDDLRTMPGEPPLERKAVGDVQMVDITSGRVIEHQEITDRV